MTAVGDRTLREERRHELAELLDLELSMLGDHTRLDDELGLDSLSRMRLLTWLESGGVALHAIDRGRPMTVGEVLSLLDRTTGRGLSIRITDGSEPFQLGQTDGPSLPTDP